MKDIVATFKTCQALPLPEAEKATDTSDGDAACGGLWAVC